MGSYVVASSVEVNIHISPHEILTEDGTLSSELLIVAGKTQRVDRGNSYEDRPTKEVHVV